jgi:hypothetical protein
VFGTHSQERAEVGTLYLVSASRGRFLPIPLDDSIQPIGSPRKIAYREKCAMVAASKRERPQCVQRLADLDFLGEEPLETSLRKCAWTVVSAVSSG